MLQLDVYKRQDIDGIRLEGSELRGAVVTALQACELAKLLGVVIKS